jgi:hypothetical protein
MITENILIATFRTHFGAPEVDNVERFFDGYVRQLDGLSTAELTAVADHILRTHKSRNWPTVGAVMDAVNATRDSTAARFSPPHPEADKATRLQAAKQMILCDLGIDAAGEGWAEELYEFCTRHGRLPQARHEIAELQARAASFEARNRNLQRSASGRVAYAGMVRRRQKRCDDIYAWVGGGAGTGGAYGQMASQQERA